MKRTKIIKHMREFLDARDYIEVETPVLSPIAGRSCSKTFTTHHNALGYRYVFKNCY